ncbi:uncharacterized protein LOC143820846 [Paroedura picta]|uniref:uncharacterized protein LOC143820846 n=1 Tax=Paroedura picta TaxID=143630 RepID=UPI0040561FBF
MTWSKPREPCQEESSGCLPSPSEREGPSGEMALVTPEQHAAREKPPVAQRSPRGAPYPCSGCEQTFQDKKDLKKHQKVVHIGEKPHGCTQCGKMFQFRSNLIVHQRLHTGEKPYSCAECGKAFRCKNKLTIHQRIHTGEKPYPCLVCGKTFRGRHPLTIHERIHRGEKPYSCAECGKSFRDTKGLRLHQRIHTGEKPYPCPECGKSFRYRNKFKTHQRIHTGEKPYLCLECGNSFRDKNQLIIHERLHTGGKPFPCNVCGKGFREKRTLKYHERIHMGEKPFACQECGKAFKFKNKLTAHQRIHTGDKPYPCQDCGKSFRDKRDLRVHQRIHTGEKPFSCKDCDSSFRYRNQLIAHEKVHFSVREDTEVLRITILEKPGGEVPGESTQKGCSSPVAGVEGSVEMGTILGNHREAVVGEAKPETNFSPNTGKDLEAGMTPENNGGWATEGLKPEAGDITAVTVGGATWEGVPVFVKSEENISDYRACGLGGSRPDPERCEEADSSSSSAGTYGRRQSFGDLLKTAQQPVLGIKTKERPHCEARGPSGPASSFHSGPATPVPQEGIAYSGRQQLPGAQAHRLLPGPSHAPRPLLRVPGTPSSWPAPLPPGLPGGGDKRGTPCDPSNLAPERRPPPPPSSPPLPARPGRRAPLFRAMAAAPQVVFEDVALYFSPEEWLELAEWQRELYQAVMMENYLAILSLGHSSAKPEVICKIERGEDVCLGEGWTPPVWRKPPSLWLAGDEIRMADEEGEGAGLSMQSPVRRRGRKKKDPSMGMERPATRARKAPAKTEAEALPRVTLKMNPPKCPECGKSFLSNVAMTIHIRTHTGERPFRCRLCPKAFPSRGDLKRHVRRHLRQEPPPAPDKNPATQGKKSLAAQLQLLHHLQHAPGPKKAHACAQCGKSFSKKQSLRKHQGTHSAERPFSCPECGRRFRLKQILVDHMKSHIQERPFACPECGKRFSQEGRVRIHQRVHTGEKPFVCMACGKRFGYKQPLLKHLRLHTGERPFSCEECGKAFRDRATLVIHNRMHTGERPYRCAFCGKQCRQKQHLNSHLRVHRGERLPTEGGTGRALQEKPHVCPTCEKRFRDRKIMLAHQKTHEEDQRRRHGSLPSGAGPSQGAAGPVSSTAGLRRRLLPGLSPAPRGAKASVACPDCGRRFAQQKYLTLHRRSHR